MKKNNKNQLMVKLSTEKDNIIGRKLRQLRNLKGVSQSVLANEIGITFQQVQKYEKGVNRISAARLHDFARILGVDVDVFYSEVDISEALLNDKHKNKKNSLAEKDSSEYIKPDIMDSKETANLLREFYKIKDQGKRKHILDFIKAMNRGEG